MSRVLLRSLVALVLVVAAGLIGWRVLKPAEVLSPASAAYPAAASRGAGVTGRTNMAPLIVDNRLRVYAGQRQVRADAPVDAKSVNTARWSLRRWPAQVSGVVASGTTVISRWSDGQLIAIDGRTGEEAWRVGTELPAPGYEGHRTGASTVWAPPGLLVGDGVVLVSGGGRLAAYEVASGARRWVADVPCADGFTTAGGQVFCGAGAYSLANGAALTTYPNGLVPLTCEVGRSGCAYLRGPDNRIYRADAAKPTALDKLVVPSGEQLLGISRGRLVTLTADRHLRVGDEQAFPLAVGTEKRDWEPGLWQVTDDFVAIERLKGKDYFTLDTVIIASL
ncbi:PQQ-binding-like beta-propeller repeat protein [Actinoplanes sp. Pm04-4]|uniref:PQQ-binding-like beta-propeller repeat protein n=1 Tax=Paractinoplanes pyxinae TaxID=2997416 RepID=A0ABT4B818_9ACTN|nr:PQQ-binding-like beta-propeller repeat protein [Actinoplanes pyxinae]MCY1142640.1 PQQ-binding-like beta-propeller repeat protein [Actinoplanes pyxinae]